MKNKGSISIQIFNLVFQALGISEQETNEIYKSAGISLELIKQADARLNADERNKLWRTISEKTRRDDIGLIAGKKFVISQYFYPFHCEISYTILVGEIRKQCHFIIDILEEGKYTITLSND